MGEHTRDSSRVPETPPCRRRARGLRQDQKTPANGSRGEDGDPDAQPRIPRDVAATLDKLRAAAAAHDGDLEYSFLAAS